MIHTDSSGLEAGRVSIDVGGFVLPAYRAMPADGRHLPVVLVVCEIFGVHEHIADVCRRFAKLGCMAIAPELFVRQGDAGSYSDIPKLVAEVVGKATDAQVHADLDAGVAWAAAHGADTRRLGITGFCWGGRITWMYCAHNPTVKAGVAWYGRVASAHVPGAPTVLDVAAQIAPPVLGLYGGADEGIPNDGVERLRGLLRDAGRNASRIVTYPDTPHAFFADYRPNHRPVQAADGWARCIGWMRAYGVLD